MPELGVVYDVPPIPIDVAASVFISCGALQFAVERRTLDEEVARKNYSDEQLAGKEMPAPDVGVSIHVNDARTGVEHLRFDCFENGPHYHYLSPGVNRAVAFDTAANGDMLTWALGVINDRIKEMLVNAGAAALAGQVLQSDIDAVMPELTQAAGARQSENSDVR